ncbi:hypothetical protein [Methylobacterium sp. CM6246]
MPNFDDPLAREFVDGLVRSAIARRVDPVARLQQFRTLQQAVIVMSRDPGLAQTAEQIVHAIDRILEELAAVIEE